jgi:PAS domain S-box-containing protein
LSYYTAAYAVIVVLLVLRRISDTWRALGFIIVMYSFAALALYSGWLAGSGRVYLLTLIVVAAVLINPRAGFVAAVICMLTYVAFGLAFNLGWLKLRPLPDPTSAPPVIVEGIGFALAISLIAMSLWLFGQALMAASRANQEAQESRASFHNIVERSSDGVLVVDQAGAICFANAAAETLLNRPPKELVGQPALFPLEVGVPLELNPGAPDNTGPVIELRVVETEWQGSSARLVLLHDITQRKQAEEALAQSEAMLHTLIETLPQNIYSKDGAGRFTYANQHYCTTEGRALDDILGKTDFDLHPAQLAQKYLADDLRVLESDQPFETVEEHQLPGGERAYVQVVKTALRSGDGRAVGTLGIFWDVTERRRAEKALHESQERYRNFIEQSMEGIWRLEFDQPIPTDLPAEEQVRRIQTTGYVAECNDAVARVYGYASSREFVGTRLLTLYGGSSSEINAQSTLELVQAGYRAANRETHEVTRTGETVYFLNNGVGIIQDQKLQALWGTRRDITELKRAEQALRESEQMYRRAIEAADAVPYYLDHITRQYTFMGDGIRSLLGYTPEEMTPQVWKLVVQQTILVGEAADLSFEEALGRARNGQIKVWKCDNLVRTRDGQMRWITDSSLVLRNDQGVVYGSIGILQDVTERRRNEQALRASEVRTRALLEAVPDMIFELDRDGTFLYFAPSPEAPPLLSPEQFIGKQVSEVMPPHIAALSLEAIRQALDTDQVQHIEYQLPAGEHLRDYEARLVASGPDHVMCIVRDITERKQAEVEREKLIGELESKNAELERFTYTVSHDLKAPLVTIRGFLGFVEKDVTAGNVGRVKSDIARIVSATNKMHTLLDDLLELSRIGRMMNPSEAVSFEAIAREAVELVRGRIEARGVQVEIASGLPQVFGDRVRLIEVVQNLVDNAVRFMGPQPAPRIEIGQCGMDADGKPIFYVRDNGVGIEPPYHDKVFGLFNKLDPQTEGTGVGLALVKRIVEAHGGRIWVESEGAGKGAMFLFTLAPRQIV